MRKPFGASLSARAMDSIGCVRQKIHEIIAKSKVPEDPGHSRNTLDWLLRLEPDADEALRIAALGHDIERALEEQKVCQADFTDFSAFKSAHALNSAQILKEVMSGCGTPDGLAEDVCRLVRCHETGGDPRSDLLKDADSLSFFEVNLPLYFQRHTQEETLQRCLWGLQRLSLERRKLLQGLRFQNEELSRLLKSVTRNIRPGD
ncbi:MAG: DUF4202 family protein [Deltaproteobacteria bacterium]|nr:DUF4202 family protein [Deltaproteobacteria bacterium]